MSRGIRRKSRLGGRRGRRQPAVAMARFPLASARLRAPDGYVGRRERGSKNLKLSGASDTLQVDSRERAQNCISHHAVGADNAGREPCNIGAQRKHPCFASRSAYIKSPGADSRKRAKRGPAVDPDSTAAPPPDLVSVLLRPLLDLPHAARRLRGPRARHDVRHVLGLRHVLLRLANQRPYIHAAVDAMVDHR